MKINDKLKVTCTGEEKIREPLVTASQYDRLKMIAYRLKDVKTLFPKKRAMAEEFVKNVSF